MADEHVTAARAAGASSSDIALIQKLKDRAADFSLARAELQRIGAAVARTNDYDLMIEYGELVNRGDAIERRIQQAMDAINGALNWARGAVGLSGRDLAALGAWFIPVAVIAAAISIIGFWLNDYMKFVRKFREADEIAAELVEQGMDPAEARRQAAAAVSQTTQGLFGALGKSVVAGALILGGIWWWSRA